MNVEQQVPFVDLVTQYSSIKEEIDAAMARVLDQAAFVGGTECERFEEDFARFCGVDHAIGVGNGTDALFLALMALGIGQGDEVLVPANTFIATSEAVSAVGATPVFVDVDPLTALIDYEAMEAAITSRTSAVIPVHLYGRACDMLRIMETARRHGIAVVEDAAQAHGARWNGKRVGGFGDAACFSFYPGKNLGAYGDAGAVVTNDDSLATRVRLLKNHGRDQKYIHKTEGYNSRLDNIQAAVLGVKLPHLDAWNRAREVAARRYRDMLDEISKIQMLAPAADGEHVYHLFVICCANRDVVKSQLRDTGVAAGVHYPLPLHLQPAYEHLGYKLGTFPHAEKLAETILSLPMYAELTPQQQEVVCTALRAAVTDSRT